MSINTANWKYIVQEGDTLSDIAYFLYGTEDENLVAYLHKNCYTYKDNTSKKGVEHIYPGDEIEVRPILDRVFKREFSNKIKSHNSGFTYFSNRNRLHCPVRFFYKDFGNNGLAERRLLYHWQKKDGEYINKGILMTDDWGQPWKIDEYIDLCKGRRDCFYPSRLEVYKPIVELHLGNYTKKGNEGDVGFYKKHHFLRVQTMIDGNHMDRSFAFYSPEQLENIKFYTNSNQINYYRDMGWLRSNPENKRMDRRVFFDPGEEYVFMFAPLDTIWGHDGIHSVKGGLKNYDPTGLDHPAEYYSQVEWDVARLVTDGHAVEVVIPSPKKLTDPVDELAIKIEVTPNLAEYISLIKKHTLHLENSLFELEIAKMPYHVIQQKLYALNNIADMIGNFPSKEIPFTKKSNIENFKRKIRETDADILKHLEKIRKKGLKGNIETEYLAFNKRKTGIKFSQEKVDHPFKFHFGHILFGLEHASLQNIEEHSISKNKDELLETEKKIYKYIPEETLEFTDPVAAGEKLVAVMDDGTFKELLHDYLSKQADLQKKKKDIFELEFDYFSFKHPIETIASAIEEAYCAISDIPNSGFVENFYKKNVKPFENLCENECNNNTELKTELKSFVSDIIAALVVDYDSDSDTQKKECEEEKKRLQDLFEKQINSTIPASADLKISKESNPLSMVWNFAKEHTGYINNQEGAQSHYAIVMTAYVSIRNKYIKNDGSFDSKILVSSVKVALVIGNVFLSILGPITGKIISASSFLQRELIRITEVLPDHWKKVLFVRNDKYNAAKIEADELEKLTRAYPVINLIASSVQLLVSVIGINSFFRSDRRLEDWIALVGCFFSGGLALTGIGKEIFDKHSYGKWLTGFGRLLQVGASTSAAFVAAIGTIKAMQKGKMGRAAISIYEYMSAGFTAKMWLAYSLGMVSPGAMTFLARWNLLSLAIMGVVEYVYAEWQTGVHNYFNAVLSTLKTEDLFHKSMKTYYLEEHTISPLKILKEGEPIINGIPFNFEIIRGFTLKQLSRNHYRKLDSQPIDFLEIAPDVKTCVFKLMEQGWQKDDIIKFFHDGWLHDRPDGEVKQEVLREYRKWVIILGKNYNELSDDERKKLVAKKKEIFEKENKHLKEKDWKKARVTIT